MVSWLGEVHIWSLKNQTIIPDGDIGCFAYQDTLTKKEAAKNPNALSESVYQDEKESYAESRNVTWAPKNKPYKLKDTLKELEELLSSQKCVKTRWVSRKVLQMVLSNGAVITCIVRIHSGDVDKIYVDKSLVGKLSADNPCDALIKDNYLVFAYPDKSRLDFIYLAKKPHLDASRKYEKISTLDPRISQVDLPGPTSRKLTRNLTCNLYQDVVTVWWATATEEALPWSPMTGDRERANLILLALNGARLELVSYTRTDCNPVSVNHSMLRPHQICTVEQSPGSGSEINVDVCVYEYNRGKIQKFSAVTLPLKSGVVSCSRDMSEDKLVLGCMDGTLVLYDEYRKMTQITSSAFVPHIVSWHPSGTVLLASSHRGEVQMFDLALSPLQFQKVAEQSTEKKTLELAPYFRYRSILTELQWSPLLETSEYILPECNDSVFLMFERGPMVLLQYYVGVMSQCVLTPLSLVNQYVKYRQIDEAIAVLCALNWNLEGQICYACLSAIFNSLLRMPLTAQRENQLERSLGTFYAPPRPLSESTVLQFRDFLSRLARRFFHHLLRFSRFEKAFLLAVDIGARDLFMDIHYVAKDKGELALAEVTKRKADEIETESLAGESGDSEDVSEESEGSIIEYSDEDYELQHVALPPRSSTRNQGLPELGSTQQLSMPTHIPCHSAPPDPRFVPRVNTRPVRQQPFMATPEIALQKLEAELASEMVDEYAAAFAEDSVIPPPSSHSDQAQPTSKKGKATPTSVRVIHFGLV